MKHIVLCIFAVSLALLCAQSNADEPASVPVDKSQYTLVNPTPAASLRGMDTDRPNRTNTPHTIDAGHLQIETGLVDYLYARDHDHGADARTDVWNVGQLNFRLGIFDRLEINLLPNAYEFIRQRDYAAHQISRQNGIGDTFIGAKLNLWGNESGDATWATALAIQPQFKIPTARENLGNGHGEFAVGLPFLLNLPADFHLAVETAGGYQRNSSNTGEVFACPTSISLDRTVIDKLDMYIEYAALLTTERHIETPQMFDVGASYPLTDNFAIDTGFAIGLNRASNDLEWTTGFSVRF